MYLLRTLRTTVKTIPAVRKIRRATGRVKVKVAVTKIAAPTTTATQTVARPVRTRRIQPTTRILAISRIELRGIRTAAIDRTTIQARTTDLLGVPRTEIVTIAI